MMQYTITRSCGHQTSETLYGKSSERESRLRWLKSQPCLTCQREARGAAAAVTAESDGLPALVGSEKQIGWALTIRAAKLSEIERFVADVQTRSDAAVANGQISRADADAAIAIEVTPAVARARMMDSAAFWIDHRAENARSLLRMCAPLVGLS